MFGMAVVLWIIDLQNLVIEVKMTLLATSDATLSDDYSSATSSILRLASIEDLLYSYMTIIGDIIIIWRVHAFWSNGRERLHLGTASSAMLTYCAARLGADIKLGTYQHPAFCRNIQTTSYSMTLATTAIATILIALKAWYSDTSNRQYTRTYFSVFRNSGPRTRTLRVMVMLIESGLLYMLFFAVQVIISISSVNAKIEQNAGLTFALTIQQYTNSLIVGIYPTIVVILVYSKHSILSSQAETSDTAVVFGRGRTATEGSAMYLDSTEEAITHSSMLLQGRDADLFEMAHAKSTESRNFGAKEENSLGVQVRRSVVYRS
ncbi:uncharacterized protein PHACADRAFT_149279 [Phanerochaete carnosa HHB-10118-sp]|uniref:Uncharacterized protein n=1 Tax=Phanerochaete carnosa (strain HHB-10118-sp) TaxID=650164 RepID=K5VM70_PHACS|nr:uncharacterized protein PHACADRAFT_149279 [Phanerochaete carnosa HHB-10118-sp]EKM52543.1 hypothetical protein PHACADRAFT_149279 [Phanerochaete carnosa HHB-10118-sp]